MSDNLISTSAICRSAIALMKDLSDAYGAEKGIEMFEKIKQVFGEDIHHQAFLIMIGGQYSDFSVRIKSGSGNKISAAESISKHTKLSIDECMSVIKSVKEHGISKTVICYDADHAASLVKELRDLNYFCD